MYVGRLLRCSGGNQINKKYKPITYAVIQKNNCISFIIYAKMKEKILGGKYA